MEELKAFYETQLLEKNNKISELNESLDDFKKQMILLLNESCKYYCCFP